MFFIQNELLIKVNKKYKDIDVYSYKFRTYEQFINGKYILDPYLSDLFFEYFNYENYSIQRCDFSRFTISQN